MNYFSKIKIGTWIVIILTIVNLACLITIFYKTSCDRKIEHSEKPDNQRQRTRFMMWKQLNLSKDQENQFKEKGKQYFDTLKIIFKTRDSLAKMISNELRKEKPDLNLMYSFSQKMGENYSKSKMLTIDHILQLKKICKPEQIVKLDSMYHFLLIGFENPRHTRLNKKAVTDSIPSKDKKAPQN